jgi:hypothetical protein
MDESWSLVLYFRILGDVSGKLETEGAESLIRAVIVALARMPVYCPSEIIPQADFL